MWYLYNHPHHHHDHHHHHHGYWVVKKWRVGYCCQSSCHGSAVESRTALIEQQKVSLSSKCLLGRRGGEEEEEKKRKRRRTRLKIMTRLWTWWIMVIDNLADEMIQIKAALIEQQKDSHFSECSLRRRNRKRRWERDKAADKSVESPRWPAAKVSSLLHLLLLVLVEGEKEAGERGRHWTDRVPAWLEKKSASGLGNLTRHWTTMSTKCWTSWTSLDWIPKDLLPSLTSYKYK